MIPLQGELIYDMAMDSNTTIVSQQAKPGRMWWILPTGFIPTEAVEYFGMSFQYNPGVQLLPGFHIFGIIEITK
jgi:hypothetical protein